MPTMTSSSPLPSIIQPLFLQMWVLVCAYLYTDLKKKKKIIVHLFNVALCLENKPQFWLPVQHGIHRDVCVDLACLIPR